MATFGPGGSTPSVLNDQSSWTEKNAGPGHPGGALQTGDLRRKYNFGSRLSELSIAQDPFFRFVSKVGKSATDDPEFKFSEKRPFWNKRYVYCMGWAQKDGTTRQFGDATLQTNNNSSTAAISAVGDQMTLAFASDFYTAGNISNVIGQGTIKIGDPGTRPLHLLPKQVIKIPVSDATGYSKMDDYILVQLISENASASNSTYTTDRSSQGGSSTAEVVWWDCEIVKFSSAGVIELTTFKDATTPMWDISSDLESVSGAKDAGMDRMQECKSDIVGTSYEEGSQLLGKTWSDQPYSTGSGLVQTFRDEWGMTNKSRATVLKYDKDEFARVWREHLIGHKWELEQAGLFGSQGKRTIDGTEYWYTQGAVDFITNYGNIFQLNTATKTADDFLEDMSKYMDPRYHGANATLFFCDTATYNWLHKLGGYFKNNIEMSSNFRADMAITGKKKVFGVDITTISTPYGDMNVARNIHLDGSNVKILGINMKYVKYRPLVGNGINRDTSIYVGVQTLENSGVDKRVDMLLTEAGYEWSMPECHAMWK